MSIETVCRSCSEEYDMRHGPCPACGLTKDEQRARAAERDAQLATAAAAARPRAGTTLNGRPLQTVGDVVTFLVEECERAGAHCAPLWGRMNSRLWRERLEALAPAAPISEAIRTLRGQPVPIEGDPEGRLDTPRAAAGEAIASFLEARIQDANPVPPPPVGPDCLKTRQVGELSDAAVPAVPAVRDPQPPVLPPLVHATASSSSGTFVCGATSGVAVQRGLAVDCPVCLKVRQQMLGEPDAAATKEPSTTYEAAYTCGGCRSKIEGSEDLVRLFITGHRCAGTPGGR